MKVSEWYARLDFGAFDILIPQSDIDDAQIWEEAVQDKSIDDFLCQGFNFENVQQVKSMLVIKGKTYYTSKVPEIQNVDTDDFLPVSRILKYSFEKRGIKSLIIKDGRIQFIFDINKFMSFCCNPGSLEK